MPTYTSCDVFCAEDGGVSTILASHSDSGDSSREAQKRMFATVGYLNTYTKAEVKQIEAAPRVPAAP